MVASYNGWKASQSPSEIGVVPFVVNGVSFPSGARGGDVGVVFGYLAEQYAKRVEPLVSPGCWGYYYKQSANSAALLSCHSSGTAIDFNAPKHPNGKRGTFTAAQVKAIRAILAELGGVVYWGGDAWGNGTPDEMHFEIDTDATVAQVAAVANKIRGMAAPTKEDDLDANQAQQLDYVYSVLKGGDPSMDVLSVLYHKLLDPLNSDNHPGNANDNPLGHAISAHKYAKAALDGLTKLGSAPVSGGSVVAGDLSDADVDRIADALAAKLAGRLQS
jgi:hypothetical protein